MSSDQAENPQVQQSQENEPQLSVQEIEIASTIFNEARGQSADGRKAVAAVINNRINYSCPKEGCQSNHGLSDWKNVTIFNGYSSEKPEVPEAQKDIWNECVELAKNIKDVEDNTDGATHFKTSAFGQGYDDKGQKGNHYFSRQQTEETRHKQ